MEECGRNIVLADKWVTQPGRGLQIRLGERFYSMIRSGFVPLDAAVVDGLRRSPLSLDTYAWLTYRVARLKEDTTIPWRSLERQFGAQYRLSRQFRWKFRRSIDEGKRLWDGADVEPRERGLLIGRSWLTRTARALGLDWTDPARQLRINGDASPHEL